jgi:ABC-2 type transport system ATP-binding protein
MYEGEWALDLAHVEKTYKGGVHALRGIEMKVRSGEVFGLLGPNGAGKSTLIKILMTVISASRCEGTVLGNRVGDTATLARVGYLPEHHQFPDYLTARQLLNYVGAMCKMPAKVRGRRIDELLETVDMTEWADKKIGSFSKGMRQRVGLAQALVNDPELVLLDEPTDGVDPGGRRDIRDLIARLKDEGKTIFINSHLLSELEMVSDRVAILLQGVVRTQGTMEELIGTRAKYRVDIAETNAAGVLGEIAARAGGLSVESGLLLETTDAAAVQPVIDALRSHGLTITKCLVDKPTLEDLFLEAVVDPETGKAAPPGAMAGRDGPAPAGSGPDANGRAH